MSKEITKAIVDEFETELKKNLPQFQRVKGEPLPTGCRVYAWQFAPDLTFYVQLNIVHAEIFFVEIAWSRNGQWPTKTLPGMPRDIPEARLRRDNPVGGDFRFRLPYLWQAKDQSWDVIRQRSFEERVREFESPDFLQKLATPVPLQEVLPKIREVVQDSVSKIGEYAVPYLLQVAKDVAVTAPTHET